MTALPRLLSGALALGLAFIALTAPAYGHAVVVETVPVDGAVLDSAPDEILVRFNEPVGALAAQVLDAGGEDVTPVDAARIEGPTLRIAVSPSLAQGSYVASYRVVSIDGHPVGGSIAFSVGQVSGRFSPPPAEADDTGWQLAMVAVRVVLYAGTFGGVGGLLFLLLVRPAEPVPARGTRRIVAALAAAGSAAALLAIGIQGGLLLGGPAASIAEAATWRTGISSSFGATAVAAVLGLALVAIGLGLRRAALLRPVACLGAAIALASFALSGHVVTAGPRWLTVPLLLAHTTAVAFWAGALLPLLHGVRMVGGAAAPAVERFSRMAVGAVMVLVTAGLAIAFLQVRSVEGLVATTYGLVLLAKIALVAGLIALAAINKLRLTPALVRGEPGAARALGRTITAETALVIAILAATAGLGTTSPPRALAGGAQDHTGHAQEARPELGLAVTIISAGRSAETVLKSARSGINAANITIRDGAGRAIEAQEVTFIAANPEAGVEPIRRNARRTESGSWAVEELLLVPAGRWDLRLDVLVNDFEKAVFETTIRLE